MNWRRLIANADNRRAVTRSNLIVGALLALVCVWWFTRDTRATVIIASTIPICLLATFRNSK